MSIKIKNRDPKTTDFSPKDIVVNVKDGTLFYKSDKALFKLQGDNLNTPTTENPSDFNNKRNEVTPLIIGLALQVIN